MGQVNCSPNRVQSMQRWEDCQMLLWNKGRCQESQLTGVRSARLMSSAHFQGQAESAAERWQQLELLQLAFNTTLKNKKRRWHHTCSYIFTVYGPTRTQVVLVQLDLWESWDLKTLVCFKYSCTVIFHFENCSSTSCSFCNHQYKWDLTAFLTSKVNFSS